MSSPNGDLHAALRRVGVFRDADDEDIRRLAALAIPRAVEEGAFFFSEGEPATFGYVLTRGRAKLCQLTPQGQQVNLRTIQPYDLFGAIGAVETGARYPVSAQALEESEALALRSDEFRELLAARPALSLALTRQMADYIREIQQRYRELATESVDRRIAHALLRLAERAAEQGARPPIHLAFSRVDLAEMTGTTLYTVSRTLSGWERAGLIATGRQRVTILDDDALARVAEGEEG